MLSELPQNGFLKQVGKSLGFKRKTQPISKFNYEGILGTSLELIVKGDAGAADHAYFTALKEINRLEAVYSRFDTSSELNQWLNHEGTFYSVSTELACLVHKALLWTKITRGAFHPGVDALSNLWHNAELENKLPEQRQIDELLEHLKSDFCSFETYNMSLTKHVPLGFNFNALAKGMIVDAAATRAFNQLDIEEGLLNIGGDLRYISHDSKEGMIVGIQNAFLTADNTSPVLSLRICNQSVATSGAARRGFQIRNRWYSHVIDPRKGWPVRKTVSATVIAPDCATADALATSFSVLKPAESLSLANSLPNVGCHLVTQAGDIYTNGFLDKHIITQNLQTF